MTFLPGLIAALATALAATVACAQGIGLPGQTRDKPLEILADQGIEWNQPRKAYIARGNAQAIQGDVAVRAEVLTAFYREAEGGRTDIWRIDADNAVRIVTPTQQAFGDKAVYDVEKGVLVLTGRNVRLVTDTDRITARDSLEYWEKRNMAVARGEAIAVRGDNRMRADLMTAEFAKDRDGKSKVSKVHVYDNVVISSPSEIVRGDRGTYNLDTGIAVLTGSVKITRGQNQLNGERAEVNLNTGVSKLFGGGPQGVRGYLVPDDLKQDEGARSNGPRRP
jgi:lipopolysaccharide export system protein LptA